MTSCLVCLIELRIQHFLIGRIESEIGLHLELSRLDAETNSWFNAVVQKHSAKQHRGASISFIQLGAKI